MTDDIDNAFTADLEKLGKGLRPELAINAAKVKAAQDPKKKGAEKPDLGAPGKGRGGKDPALKKESARKPIFDASEVAKAIGRAATSKPALAASGVLGGVAVGSEYERRRKKKREKKAALDPLKAGAAMLPFAAAATIAHEQAKKKKMKKKASIDDDFNGDLHQIVGLDVPSADSGFERPDVTIPDQVEDAIDEHYLGWMRDKADEDVVKTAAGKDVVREILQSGGVKKGTKLLEEYAKKGRRAAALKGAVAGAGGTAALAGGAALAAKRSGVKTEGGQEKQAGVIENDENKDLLARIRASAAKGLAHGCGDA